MSELRNDDDIVVPFQVADTAVRGRLVRLGPAVDDILKRHAYEDAASALVGEATCLVAMMGAALKFDGKLIFQAQGDGPVSMLVADFSAGGALRAMAKVNSALGETKDAALVGKGHMVMTIDQGPDMERYQGVTPFDGTTLADAAIAYFDQSEQIPTAMRLAVGRMRLPGGEEMWRAGGIMAQFVPGEGGVRERGKSLLMDDNDRENWDRAAAFIQSVQDDELLDPNVTPNTLLYRLFHEDGVRVYEPTSLRAECACTSDKIAAVLSRYSEDELADMIEDDRISVVCEFCRRSYLFDAAGAPIPAP